MDNDLLYSIAEWIQGLEMFGNCVFVVFTLILMILCNLGYTVYHIAMYKNHNSDVLLLNMVYQHLALVFQVHGIVLAINVSYFN